MRALVLMGLGLSLIGCGDKEPTPDTGDVDTDDTS
ncbi:MAG: hypothetical protein ACI8RZ_004097, partial [Myxococcota bacterium]